MEAGQVERRLGVTEARKEFSQMIDDVKYRGNDYVIVRRGEPAAAVVPFERQDQVRVTLQGAAARQ